MKNIIFPFLLFLAQPVLAQQAVVPAGGNAHSNAGSVSYSIGQVSYLSHHNNDYIIIEGVQQAYVTADDSTGIIQQTTEDLDIKLFPNPASYSVHLVIEGQRPKGILTYVLLDALGRPIRRGAIPGAKTEIDLQGFSAGSYMLRVVQNNRPVKTFKLIKTK